VKLYRIIAGMQQALRAYVHDSVRADALACERHRGFISAQLFSGLLALCTFPLYLAIVGKPGLVETIAFIWLMTPIAIAAFLSRTGRLEAAHLLSAANLTCLVTFVAAMTGGVQSFLIAWLIVIPVEASLSTSRRAVFAAIMMACTALAGLHLAGLAGALPPPRQFGIELPVLMAIGVMSVIIYIGGVAMNVERLHRHSLSAVREGEARYRLLAENTTDMITRHSRNGHAMFVSHAARSLINCSAESLLADGLFDRVHLLDRPAFLSVFAAAYAGKGPVAVEFRIARDAGPAAPPEYVWAEMRCRVDECGDIVAVTRDISEQKAQEQMIIEARDVAEKANVAKTHFLANISHELRTPLNAIIGFSDILTQDLFGRLENERHREYSALINQSGKHLLQLVNDLLDMSKLDAGKYSLEYADFDVSALIENVKSSLEPVARQADLGITLELPANPVSLNADERACRQILINLVSNAIKFSKPAGQVTIRLQKRAGQVELTVIDRGIGISADDLARLGKPFVQADSAYDRKYEGTGLGLSIVKGLVELHEGTFRIHSRQGAGTSVVVSLPAAAEITPLLPKIERQASRPEPSLKAGA